MEVDSGYQGCTPLDTHNILDKCFIKRELFNISLTVSKCHTT